MLSIPLWHMCSERFGKVNAMTLSMVIFIPGCVTLGFNPSDTPTYVCVMLSIYAGFTLGAVYLIPWMMLTDTIDEHELKTGKRCVKALRFRVFAWALVHVAVNMHNVENRLKTALERYYGVDRHEPRCGCWTISGVQKYVVD